MLTEFEKFGIKTFDHNDVISEMIKCYFYDYFKVIPIYSQFGMLDGGIPKNRLLLDTTIVKILHRRTGCELEK